MSERLSTEERAAVRSAAFIGPTLYGIVEDILAARLADQTARLAAVEALADEWEREGASLIEHCYDAREVHEGSTMQSCADLLRAALHPDPSEART